MRPETQDAPATGAGAGLTVGDVGPVPVTRLGYRPELDALRGVAILSVVGLHWFPKTVRGGHIGVDLFFVLSGFLITTLLLEEHATGGVSLRRFWTRRFRRLMPAYLLLVAALCWVDGAWWTAVYAGNFGIIAGQVGEPLRHTWSLAIEEQFYAVWPLLFLFLVRFPRRVAVTLLLAGAGLMWLNMVLTPSVEASFSIGTFTRPSGLLVGCALAFARPSPWLHRMAALWPLAVGVLPALLLAGASSAMHPVALAVFAVLVVAAVEFQPRPPEWLRGVGLLSYSLYLWHYPITVGFRHAGWFHGPTGLLVIPASFTAAWLSWQLVERRFRTGRPTHQCCSSSRVTTT